MEVIVAPEPMDYEIRGMYRFATLREDSGLAEAVRGRWPENPRLLMIAAEPDNDTYTENLAMDLATALVKADLPVGELRVLQRETADVAAQLIAGADVIVLADGEGDDADAQREAFFAELGVPGPARRPQRRRRGHRALRGGARRHRLAESPLTILCRFGIGRVTAARMRHHGPFVHRQ